MKRITTIRLTNNLAIFIITGIIYVFIEVFSTSFIFAPEMGKKFSFKPISTALYEKMAFQPPCDSIAIDFVYLKGISNLSLIGASSIWMFFVGGICGLFLYLLYTQLKKRVNLFFLCLLGTGLITIIELVSGIILNGFLGLFLWDYTKEFGNVLGQICLSHSIAYLVLICPFAYWLFHFIEAQYPEYDKNVYSLLSHYQYLCIPFEKNTQAMVKKILEKSH